MINNRLMQGDNNSGLKFVNLELKEVNHRQKVANPKLK